MKELLEYIVKGITGKDSFSIDEKEEDGKTLLTILLEESEMGLVIGKNGLVIKSIQNILQVKGRLENKLVFVNVENKSN